MVNKKYIYHFHNFKYSEDERNIFVPRGVAEVSPFIKKQIYEIVHEGNSYFI